MENLSRLKEGWGQKKKRSCLQAARGGGGKAGEEMAKKVGERRGRRKNKTFEKNFAPWSTDGSELFGKKGETG